MKNKVNSITTRDIQQARLTRYLSVSRISYKNTRRFTLDELDQGAYTPALAKAADDVIAAMEDNNQTDEEFDEKYWGKTA